MGNVYTQEFDAGGAFWFELFNGSMFGLLLGTLSLCGVAGIRGVDKREFWAMWALPVLIVAFQVRCRKYYRYSNFMPLEDAVSVDRGVSDKVAAGFRRDFYQDPIINMSLSNGVDMYSALESHESFDSDSDDQTP